MLLLFICLVFLRLGLTKSQQELNFQTNEELPIGTIIGNITRAVQKLISSQDNFNLKLLERENSHFNLIDGLLMIKRPIDREVHCILQPICKLEEEVAVTFEYSGEVELIRILVEVRDTNDNSPTFPEAIHHLQISESARVTSSYVLPHASDDDIDRFSIQRYALHTTDVDTNRTFALKYNLTVVNTLMIAVMQRLDREIRSSYEFDVIASDGGNPPKESSLLVKVIVTDTNDHQPVFNKTKYLADVKENNENGTFVIQVRADDRDSGANGEITYSFSSQVPQSIKNLFTIDPKTGIIKTTTPLDRESRAQYSLHIEAKDGGVDAIPAYCTVKISVLDENDNPPLIRITSITSSASVIEHQQVPLQLAVVLVNDKDEGRNGEFSCKVEDSKLFELISSNGESGRYILRLITDIDREELGSKISATISCWDSGSSKKQSITNYNISIVDINDQTPSFSADQYSVEVEENTDSNTPIIEMFAKDLDLGVNSLVRYSLDSNSVEYFRIGEISGILSSVKPLDREEKDNYFIAVYAKDQGIPSLTASTLVRVLVTDVNDIKPHFSANPLVLHVAENLPPDVPLGPLVASDEDLGPSGEVEYTLIPGFGDFESFRINSSSGIFYPLTSFDREVTQEYALKVAATDKGSPRLSGIVDVRVKVEDENDNYPTIVYPQGPERNINITFHTKPGTVILHIVAVDSDIGRNAKLQYKLSETSNYHDLFDINEVTGEVRVERLMETGMVGAHELHVIVNDQGVTQRTAEVDLIIYIGFYDNETNILNNIKEFNQAERLNTVIVTVVACVSGVLIVCLSLAICLVLRHRLCLVRRKSNPELSDLREGVPPSSVQSSKHAQRKEVSFSSDVQGITTASGPVLHNTTRDQVYGFQHQQPRIDLVRGTSTGILHSKPLSRLKSGTRSKPQEVRFDTSATVRLHTPDTSDSDSGKGASLEEQGEDRYSREKQNQSIT